LNQLHLGPEPIFFLHLALFWAGVAAMGAGLARFNWRLGALFPLIGLLPFVFNFLGLLWKDVAIAAAWTFACAIAFRRFARDEKLGAVDHALIWPALLYGALVRANSIFAIAPLGLYLLSGDVFSRKLYPQLAALVIAPALILVSASVVNHGLLHAEAQHPEDSLFLFDMIGVSHRIGVNTVPGPWTTVEAAQIPKCYAPDKWDLIGKCAFITATLDDHDIWGAPPVREAWLNTIGAHPCDYAAHRLTFANSFLRWLGPIPVHDAFMESEQTDPRWRAHPGSIFRAYQGLCKALESSPLFRPYFWLLLSLAIAVGAWFAAPSAQRRFAAALSISAAIYVLTYVPFGVASDFRYAYWSIIATLAAGAALMTCKIRHARQVFGVSGAVILVAVAISALS